MLKKIKINKGAPWNHRRFYDQAEEKVQLSEKVPEKEVGSQPEAMLGKQKAAR